MTNYAAPLGFRAYAESAPHLTEDVVVFSHLRWNFVYQRPQHLLSRIAARQRVFFFEEPIVSSVQRGVGCLVLRQAGQAITVLTPHVPPSLTEEESNVRLRKLVEDFIQGSASKRFISWYYTPMALGFTSQLRPVLTVYDCMDELSGFAGAHPLMRKRELTLLGRSDIVFTGGESLFRVKQHMHKNIHPFPSSIDAAHFHKARLEQVDPDDQALIPHPRGGFFGVIDERMDVELLGSVAEQRPDWNFILLGPVVKIDPRKLPRRANIHYLGARSYETLPAYLAHWDVALLPFAMNDATRFISPTKTPEYLAGGKPVVSTPIQDVVAPYGNLGLVHIAGTVDAFAAALDTALQQVGDEAWLQRIDTFLNGMSWDNTWAEMEALLVNTYREKHPEFPIPLEDPSSQMLSRLL